MHRVSQQMQEVSRTSRTMSKKESNQDKSGVFNLVARLYCSGNTRCFTSRFIQQEIWLLKSPIYICYLDVKSVMLNYNSKSTVQSSCFSYLYNKSVMLNCVIKLTVFFCFYKFVSSKFIDFWGQKENFLNLLNIFIHLKLNFNFFIIFT